MWKRLKNVFKRREINDEFFSELESVLLSSDVGISLTEIWMERVRKWKSVEDVRRILTEEMLKLLEPAQSEACFAAVGTNEPRVIMIVGVNGAGKTTSIAKLTNYALKNGSKPLLVAGDTFRAAAIEQLQIWGERLGVSVIAQAHGSDAAAVTFDGIKAGQARNSDCVIIDTAGRLQTKVPLMDEIAKVRRVAAKAQARAPHECWCVLDAMTGQNAISQVEKFHQTMELTGLIITKLDGSAKAGAIFPILQKLALPLLFIGTGEAVGDLRPFNARAFIDDILRPITESAA